MRCAPLYSISSKAWAGREGQGGKIGAPGLPRIWKVRKKSQKNNRFAARLQFRPCLRRVLRKIDSEDHDRFSTSAVCHELLRPIALSGLLGAIDRCGVAPLHTALGEPVAQLVEHLTFNQVVLGSSPSRLTKRFQALTAVQSSTKKSKKIDGAPARATSFDDSCANRTLSVHIT
jgi:hypothetical protein